MDDDRDPEGFDWIDELSDEEVEQLVRLIWPRPPVSYGVESANSSSSSSRK